MTNTADVLKELTEPQVWDLSRYLADYVHHEIKSGKKIDKHTMFFAIDAILGGALD
jgi:hypothetical protein